MKTEKSQIAKILRTAGDAFAGADAAATAADWLDCGFGPEAVGEWVAIGVWSAAAAEALADEGLAPDVVAAAAAAMVEGMDDDERRRRYTDGSPIYALCQGDVSASDFRTAEQA